MADKTGKTHPTVIQETEHLTENLEPEFTDSESEILL